MQRNYKVKYAVTTALSLIAFGFQPAANALGLTDIEVKSNLGQPLKAKVNVLGAGELKDTSCLRLGPNSDLTHVNFILGPLSGDVAKLTVTSNKVINEPILNLSIVAGCDSTITRDYVLLLDPPFSTQIESVQINPIEEAVVIQKIDTSVETSTDVTATSNQKENTNNSKIAVASKKTTAKKAKKSTVVAKKSAGVPQLASKLAAETQPLPAPEARLTISAGSLPSTNTLGLRLDRQLSFTPDPNTAISTNDVVIEDEVTAMNKRLAHLQQQITALEKQNLKLASDNKLKSEQLSEANGFHFSNILPFIGAAALLLGGYIGFSWFRRRQQRLQDHEAKAIWTNANLNFEQNEPDVSKPAIKAEELFNDEVNFDIKPSAKDDHLMPKSMESTFESTKTEEQQIVLEEDEQFSVLDHADVFLSHGRSTLAIQLLQNHLLDHPKQSVTIWLFLLDLLAKDGLESLYEQTAQDCKLHFNVKIAAFSKLEANDNASLEDFPRLEKGLEQVWNTPAAVAYLDDLIYNNRLEPRAGLAKNLIEELILLRSIAQENVNTAEVIHLDQKKLAIVEQKEALLEARKAEKLKAMAEAERVEREKAEKAKAEETETDFEFTLIEKY